MFESTTRLINTSARTIHQLSLLGGAIRPAKEGSSTPLGGVGAAECEPVRRGAFPRPAQKQDNGWGARSISAALALGCALLLLTVGPAYAATFTVTLFADANSGGAAGTGPGNSGDLRYAINHANAAGGTNTIVFSSDRTTTSPCIIMLNGPLPPIEGN